MHLFFLPAKVWWSIVYKLKLKKKRLSWLWDRLEFTHTIYHWYFQNPFYDITAQKMKFSTKGFFSKCDHIRSETADLVTVIEEILNRKLHFLCSVSRRNLHWGCFMLKRVDWQSHQFIDPLAVFLLYGNQLIDWVTPIYCEHLSFMC